MKTKHVIASLGLAMTTAFALAVGAGPRKEAKSVKAEGEKTWMVNFNINLHEMVNYEGFNGDSVKVYLWDSANASNKKEFAMHQSGISAMYTVNATFEDGFEFNSVRYEYYQGYDAKQSRVYDTVSNQTKAAHYRGITNMSYGHWDDENYVTEWAEDDDHVWRWKISGNLFYDPYLRIGDTQITLDEDVSSSMFYKTSVVVEIPENQEVYLNIQFAHDWRGSTVMTESAKTLFKYTAENGSPFKESGTYDFFFSNDYHDGGILDIRKHEGPVETYIYYVLEEGYETTNDYIYSWGGESQFESWPGTKVTEAGIEVTGNGILHFQGCEGKKLIYKIPVKIGYPEGDLSFKWNNNNDWESEAFTLVAGAAYWYTGGANVEAGHALDVLLLAEGSRNTSLDYSVCNVSAEKAKTVVDAYNALTDAERAYVNSTKVYTYTTEEKGQGAPEGLVSYADIIVMLGEIGGVTPVGLSLRNHQEMFDNYKANTTIIIVVAASISAIALAGLLLIKKRKHN